MKHVVWILALAACGGGQTAGPDPGVVDDDPPGVVQDTRTPIEKRRDAACEQLRPKLVACAVEDARAERDAGRMSEQDFQANTAPAIQAKLGEEWMEACLVDMSSRQVRVLEVCFQEEAECEPLLSCLEHLNAKQE